MSKKKWLPKAEWIKQQKEKAKYASTPAERDKVLKIKNKASDFIDNIREDFLNSLSKEKPLWEAEKTNSLGPVSNAVYIPFNLATGKPYKGVNWFFLSYKVFTGASAFATFSQCKSKGWKVKKGSSAYPVIFARKAYSDNAIDNKVDKAIDRYMKKEGQVNSDELTKIREQIEKTYSRPVYKCANVFSADDICLPPELEEAHLKPVIPEGIINTLKNHHKVNFHNRLSNNNSYGVYDYVADKVLIRKPEHFDSQDHWTATALHELTHWAGHESRTNTLHLDNIPKEEMIAELGAWILCRQVGIDMRTRHIKYLKKYYELIKKDKKSLTDCIKTAQKRTDYLMKNIEYKIAGV